MANPSFPAFEEIPYGDPCQLFLLLASHLDMPVFFDSAMAHETLSRYSYIAADPFYQIILQEAETNPLEEVRNRLAQFKLDTHPDLPPFQGGVAGILSYDLAFYLENLPQNQPKALNFPELSIGFYDTVFAFDHALKKAWIISTGFPKRIEEHRLKRAQERLTFFKQALDYEVPLPKKQSLSLDWHPDSDRQTYENNVQKIIDHIYQGTFCQANMTQRWSAQTPHDFDPIALYMEMRKKNAAPFGGFFQFNDSYVLSASPERFLKMTEDQVETRPIKGTIKRAADQQQDKMLAENLEKSEKDRAENIMICDLLRNDLSKVCTDDSIDVPDLCKIESYATVHHLTSVVTGTLRPDKTALDLFQACFPGGSITGAPKIKACEVIAKLEPARREPFYGSLAWLGFNGNMDSNLLIRTVIAHNQTLALQTGGGIVADSNPAQEYEEMILKAKAFFDLTTPDKKKGSA